MVMYYIFLLILAVFPTVVILTLVYNNDKEKEPITLLAALFGVGVLSCFLTIFLSQVVEVLFPFLESNKIEESGFIVLLIYTFFKIGLIEETSKWIFNYSISWNNKEFDHIYDSIVYSTFVSLGFATFENILYVMMSGVSTGILRAVVSVPAHAFFAANMGYYIGLSKMASINGKSKLSTKYMIFSILIPMLLHGTFDFFLMSGVPIILVLAIIIFLYWLGIKRVKQFSKIENNLINKEKYYPYYSAEG